MSEVDDLILKLKEALKHEARKELIAQIANGNLPKAAATPRALVARVKMGRPVGSGARPFDDAKFLGLLPASSGFLRERMGETRNRVLAHANRLRAAGLIEMRGDRSTATWHRVEPRS